MGGQFQQNQGAQGVPAEPGVGSGGGGGGNGGPTGGNGPASKDANPKRFRLYVGSLAYSTTTAALRQAFEEFGTLLDAEVVYDRSNHSKGFGFVSYGDEESMRKAIDKMNNAELDGRKIEVTVAMPQGPKFGTMGYNGPRGGMDFGRGPPRGFRVIISGLPHSITWRNLKDFLREAGCEVKYADIIGPGVGMGEFGTPADRVNAIKTLNGKELKGSKIHIKNMDDSDMPFGGGGGGFGPRPGYFNEPFGFGGFDMFGPGFDHFPYGMPPPDFNMMGFPPPPGMHGWVGRNGPRHPGYGGMGPHMGMTGGYGRSNPGARWGGYGYDRPAGGRGYDRGDSARAYDRRAEMPGGGYSGYERPPDSSHGYSRNAQSVVDRPPPDDRNTQGNRGYSQYSDRYGGSGDGYPRQYESSGKDGYGYGNYGRSGGQDAQGYGGRYDASQAPSGYDRTAQDSRAYAAYNRTNQDDSRSYTDYRGTGQPDSYVSGSYTGYGSTGYSKQGASGGGERSYDYGKSQTPEDYAKYRGGEYGRSDRSDYAGYQQDRRAYDYSRLDGRSYESDYKRAESEYYGERRDYGNGRSHREEDLRGAGGAERRRSHAHRAGPYDR